MTSAVRTDTILKNLGVIFGLLLLGLNLHVIDAVDITIINGLANFSDQSVECNTSVTIHCKGPSNIILLQWRINYTVHFNSDLVATCDSSCRTFNNFSGRYIFTYDSASKTSNLTIYPVLAEDQGRKYVCDDGSFPPPVEPQIKVLPSYTTTKNYTNYTSEGTELSVVTTCIFPAYDTQFNWFSTSKIGVRRNYSQTKTDVFECAEKSLCFLLESAHIASYLKLPKVANGKSQWSEFAVEVVYHNAIKFILPVGSYEEEDSSTTPVNENSSTTPINNILSTTPINNNSTTTPVNNNSTTPINISLSTSLSSETTKPVTPNITTESETDRQIKVLIYVGAAVGGIIVVAIIIYIVCLAYRQKKGHLKNLVT